MKRGKKGVSSHIEMIFSFVLFAMFVFFLLMYIKPYRADTLSNTISDSLKDSLIREASVNVKRVFIGVDSNSGCVSLDLGFSGGGCIAKNLNGVVLDCGISGDNLIVSDSDDFYYVYLSDIFSNSACSSPISLDSENYTIGRVENLKFISEKAIKELEGMNYEILKDKLNSPVSVDFLISSEGIEIGNSDIPESVSVFASKYNLKLIKINGDIESRDFVVRIW